MFRCNIPCKNTFHQVTITFWWWHFLALLIFWHRAYFGIVTAKRYLSLWLWFNLKYLPRRHGNRTYFLNVLRLSSSCSWRNWLTSPSHFCVWRGNCMGFPYFQVARSCQACSFFFCTFQRCLVCVARAVGASEAGISRASRTGVAKRNLQICEKINTMLGLFAVAAAVCLHRMSACGWHRQHFRGPPPGGFPLANRPSYRGKKGVFMVGAWPSMVCHRYG